MAVTYQSLQSNSIADADLVITKPTSLAVGDLLLAAIFFSDDNSGSGGINTPSGWTLLNTTNTGSPTHEVMAIFLKQADSSDVAATDFTFTRSGGDTAYHLIGHLLRITDFGSVVGSSSNTETASDGVVTLTGFTPTRPDTLFIGFLGNSDGSTVLNTSIALATDNPSWTERAETSFNDAARDSTLSTYTATRSAVTATGNITATYASATNAAHAYVVALSERLDGSIEPETHVNVYAYNAYDNVSALEAIVEDPEMEEGPGQTIWTPENKPSTTWTPDSK